MSGSRETVGDYRTDGRRQVPVGARRRRAARRQGERGDRERRRDAAVSRHGHRDGEAARQRAPWHPASSTRCPGCHRNRDRGALPAGRRGGHRGDRSPGSGAGRGGRLDAVCPIPARRLVVSRNRSFSTREMGAASGRGRGGSAARRVSPPRPGCSRGNPAHRCPAHGAGARGGRTHRAAICRVRATHRCAAVGHGYRRVGLSDNDSRRAVGPSHRPDV
ncbi:Uncharacterised protein [Mycobacterium tuberculosis]|nr:Uncharacterised protein [Mycobacterium tuberculosis]